MKKIGIWYTAIFSEEIEVPDDWEYKNFEDLLEYTDLPFDNPSAELHDWGLEDL